MFFTERPRVSVRLVFQGFRGEQFYLSCINACYDTQNRLCLEGNANMAIGIKWTLNGTEVQIDPHASALVSQYNSPIRASECKMVEQLRRQDR